MFSKTPNSLVLFALLGSATLSAQTVDYPDSSLATPPQFSFPFYTTGAGQTGNPVRLQLLVPDSFLSSQSLSAGLVTKVGFSLAGVAPYNQFVLRAGVAGSPSLGADWNVNLPDQRVQNDQSGTTISGGGTAQNPVNQWVEFELDFPFYYTPGDSVVVDITSLVQAPGVFLGTTVGGVERAYNFSYSSGQSATSFNSGGVSVRLVFESHELVSYGAGCQGSNALTPALSGFGAPAIGHAGFTLVAQNGLPGAFGGFLLGFSRNVWSGGALPADFGAGCSLLTSADAVATVLLDNTGSGAIGFAIPSDPAFRGTVFYAQFANVDLQSNANVPGAFSNGGIIAVW
ncbi:MAG: hypothetical protein NXI31_10410 [bacterium]|nr:hypothetical protein [bacterium]